MNLGLLRVTCGQMDLFVAKLGSSWVTGKSLIRVSGVRVIETP